MLEEYFGGKKNVPDKMEAVVKRGEAKIDERLKMLRRYFLHLGRTKLGSKSQMIAWTWI